MAWVIPSYEGSVRTSGSETPFGFLNFVMCDSLGPSLRQYWTFFFFLRMKVVPMIWTAAHKWLFTLGDKRGPTSGSSMDSSSSPSLNTLSCARKTTSIGRFLQRVTRPFSSAAMSPHWLFVKVPKSPARRLALIAFIAPFAAFASQ